MFDANDATSLEDAIIEDDHDTRLESHMSLYHWTMFDAQDQLGMYRDIVYMKNDLEDQIMRQKVDIKLLLEGTEEAQDDLSSKQERIRSLAGEILE